MSLIKSSWCPVLSSNQCMLGINSMLVLYFILLLSCKHLCFRKSGWRAWTKSWAIPFLSFFSSLTSWGNCRNGCSLQPKTERRGYEMMRCTCSMFWTEGSSQFFCFHLSRCPHHPVMWWVSFILLPAYILSVYASCFWFPLLLYVRSFSYLVTQSRQLEKSKHTRFQAVSTKN